VDFVNTHVLAGRPAERDRDPPDFLLVNEQSMQFQSKRKRAPVPIMAGEPNPRQPYMKRLQKYHEWRARLKKRKATWADANGVTHFMVYALNSRHEHLHPHYQVLLETMSLVADVKASSIHSRVCILDREIHYLCRPWDEPQDHKLRAREKRRKAVRIKMAVYDGEDALTKVESKLNSHEYSDFSSSDSDLSQALI
jgi:REP element-mobilizing transposase RayT